MNRYTILVLFAVCLLSSCSENKNSPEQLNLRIEDADGKAQDALGKADELESKVSDLEDRIDQLEANQ